MMSLGHQATTAVTFTSVTSRNGSSSCPQSISRVEKRQPVWILIDHSASANLQELVMNAKYSKGIPYFIYGLFSPKSFQESCLIPEHIIDMWISLLWIFFLTDKLVDGKVKNSILSRCLRGIRKSWICWNDDVRKGIIKVCLDLFEFACFHGMCKNDINFELREYCLILSAFI